ncbi:hypothetical protein OH76DRAFT_1404695 [Lentinus brumalis]|uniref:Uncharacterized protein n=1 Tax=Lentinus brumalis TaxID=2498619 RepID=A0A371D7B6_9APHY|nr:hypothetical protein OH76DRAFT_1404695 [Polyporus brumalis]
MPSCSLLSRPQQPACSPPLPHRHASRGVSPQLPCPSPSCRTLLDPPNPNTERQSVHPRYVLLPGPKLHYCAADRPPAVAVAVANPPSAVSRMQQRVPARVRHVSPAPGVPAHGLLTHVPPGVTGSHPIPSHPRRQT